MHPLISNHRVKPLRHPLMRQNTNGTGIFPSSTTVWPFHINTRSVTKCLELATFLSVAHQLLLQQCNRITMYPTQTRSKSWPLCWNSNRH